jgi:hypothetical protein
MLASAITEWPAGVGWVLEPKYDGYRLNPPILRLMRKGCAVLVACVEPTAVAVPIERRRWL